MPPGISTAHLVGNSLGGWIALELAARGRARSVLALSPSFGWEYGPHVDAVVAKFRVARRVYRLVDPLADLAVVDRNPITCDIDSLPPTQVLRTTVGGRVVHDSDALAATSSVAAAPTS